MLRFLIEDKLSIVQSLDPFPRTADVVTITICLSRVLSYHDGLRNVLWRPTAPPLLFPQLSSRDGVKPFSEPKTSKQVLRVCLREKLEITNKENKIYKKKTKKKKDNWGIPQQSVVLKPLNAN